MTFSITLPYQLADDLLKVVHYANQKLDNPKDYLQPEDVIRSALVYFIPKFVRSDLIHHHEVPSLSYLGDKQLPLKNKLKSHLKKIGKSGARFAREIGISTGNMSDILNNKSQPSLDVFLRIYFSLNCPNLDDILYRETS